MQKNDRGFSLVELIVVIAILGIMTGLVSLSLSSVFSARARRCAESIDALLSMCKVNAVSRAEEVYITISADGNGILGSYYEGGTLKQSERFADSHTSVSYALDSGDSVTLGDGDSLALSFDRSTGAFNPCSGANFCTQISAMRGRTYTITLVPSTGNHYID